MARAGVLAGCSEQAHALTRRFATSALAEASAHLIEWMQTAGMGTSIDAVGNVRGRYESAAPGAATLLVGSHLDTVPNAGRWDGTLGVLVALAAVERLHATGRRLPFALEVVAFSDEEGTRYGTAYLGSSAFVGTFDEAWLQRRDSDGVTMAEALLAAGGDPRAIADARRDPADLLGYLETHIEQGPVLETEAEPLGVVTAIVGQTRARVSLSGMAGHAGTVPPELRRDALCAAAEIVLAAERLARDTAGLVATVGELTVQPGSSNVIPGHVVLSIDARHPSDAVRVRAIAALAARAAAIGAARQIAVSWEPLFEQPAVACDERLTALLERALGESGLPARRLPSGAGHDAATLARVTPVAMLFVRCAGGISHHPDEAVTASDVAAAIGVVSRFVDLLAGAPHSGRAGVA